MVIDFHCLFIRGFLKDRIELNFNKLSWCVCAVLGTFWNRSEGRRGRKAAVKVRFGC